MNAYTSRFRRLFGLGVFFILPSLAIAQVSPEAIDEVVASFQVDNGLRFWDLQFQQVSADPAALKQDKITPVKKYSVERGEARQGIAVDSEHFYPVGTQLVAKYGKKTRKRISRWIPNPEHKIIHLDSGMVFEKKLYLGHSNWPGIPMKSSIEIVDCETMKHEKSIPLPNHGSCTWIDRYDNSWWICYGHYDGQGGEKDKGPADTLLVKYDDDFKELQRWTFPKNVISSFGKFTASGGSFSEEGTLFCTGHHEPEIYLLKIEPKAKVLTHIKTIKTPSKGHGISWDRSQKDRILFHVERNENKVIVTQYEKSPK